MILQNLEKAGGNATVFMVEGRSVILEAGKRIKVPNDFKYNPKKFKEIIKLASRRYKVEVRDGIKVRGSLIKHVTKQI